MKQEFKCEVCNVDDETIKIVFDTVEQKFVHTTCKTKHNAWRDDLATINERKEV